MMDSSWILLAVSAVTVGVVHTVVGPDHYLPFVAIGAARGWSRRRLLAVTALCGGLHIGTSMLIALVIGGLMGLGTAKIEETFGWQGSVVAWALVVLGVGYAIWGLMRPHRHRHLPDGSHLPGEFEGRTPPGTEAHQHEHEHEHEHEHVHAHADGQTHAHAHAHEPEPEAAAARKDVTIWTLVLIFAFGPCEAMIPLVMLPAARGSIGGLALVLGLFGTVTVATMMVMVTILHAGIELLPTARLSRFGHPLAGAVVALCGVAILLGL